MFYSNKKNIIKRIVGLFICLTFFTAPIMSLIFANTEVKNYKPIYGTLTANVNFREAPALNSKKISVLKKGEGIKMLGESGKFYIVQLGSNQVGYVSKSYVKFTKSPPSGAKVYQSLAPKMLTVNANGVNLRRGPGTNFSRISSLSKGTSVKVIGIIGEFYLVILKDYTVGMMHKDYVSATTNSTTNSVSTAEKNIKASPTTNLSKEEYLLKLINDYRAKNGVKPLSFGVTLNKISKMKSDDMVQNDYFSHTSPKYGTPFEMMKNNGLNYKSAGENIAGNPSLDKAMDSWINSEGHRKNILSSSFNYIGIGITESPKYGNVIVTMFAGI
ncbi:MAG: CAP domain-containing protein [Clostridia bacterium]|nr:CAP domain-containing protein [Clostridia bacterium]MDD4375722.1 CAP domain-containing protein [Clostridia bacterium]